MREAYRKPSGFISALNRSRKAQKMQDFLMQLRVTLLPTPTQGAGFFVTAQCPTTVYGIKPMIVRIIVVVRSVDGGVFVSPGVGGGGSALPGECNTPAKAETVRVRLRATTAPVRRSLFTCGAS